VRSRRDVPALQHCASVAARLPNGDMKARSGRGGTHAGTASATRRARHASPISTAPVSRASTARAMVSRRPDPERIGIEPDSVPLLAATVRIIRARLES
jgi:hypothetical protein